MCLAVVESILDVREIGMCEWETAAASAGSTNFPARSRVRKMVPDGASLGQASKTKPHGERGPVPTFPKEALFIFQYRKKGPYIMNT